MSKIRGAGERAFRDASWDVVRRYIHLGTKADQKAAEELLEAFGLQIEGDWVVGSELPIWVAGNRSRISWYIGKINARISLRADQLREWWRVFGEDGSPGMQSNLLSPINKPAGWP